MWLPCDRCHTSVTCNVTSYLLSKSKINKNKKNKIKAKENGTKFIVYSSDKNLVWIDSSNISSNHLAKKLAFKKTRPFLVIKKIELLAYKL